MTWCTERGIELRYILPDKPTQNGFIGRFNRTYRTEVLNAYVSNFWSKFENQCRWLQIYNEARPHDALAGLTPATYRAQVEAKSSPFKVSR